MTKSSIKAPLKRLASVFGATLAIAIIAAGMTPAVYAAPTSSNPHLPPAGSGHKPVCGPPAAGTARCHSSVVTDAKTAQPLVSTTYTTGYRPSDITSAYNLPAAPAAGTPFTPSGQTVAIVDAYDNPNAASDLVTYRQQFGLPLCATTNPTPTTNDLVGCLLKKVNQSGAASPMPAADVSWGKEINLDLDMVSATCPSCNILLVETNSAAWTDLVKGVDSAVALKANVVSNSYGGSEFSSETTSSYGGHYNHPGVAIVASSGDSGYGVQFPASSPYVTSVGGTTLTADSSTRGWSETAWSGAGSGCSRYFSRGSWQPSIGGCSRRIVADVSAVANPQTGVAMYDSYGSSNGLNWWTYGGTSVAAPIISSIYALAGNSGGSAPTIKYSEFPYAHKTSLFDVTSGSNGTCTSTYSKTALPLCTAVVGQDGPTGLGTPNGIGAF